jgi:hypothetical protein
MTEVLIIVFCWLVVGTISEILHVKYAEDPGYNTEDLTKVGLRCLTCWYIIRKSVEILLGLLIYIVVWTWKIVRIPIRCLGFICRRAKRKDQEEIDEIEV